MSLGKALTSKTRALLIFLGAAGASFLIFAGLFLLTRALLFEPSVYEISGRVVDSSGSPISGVQVFAQNFDDEQRVYFAVSGEDGTYRIRAGAPGDFILWTRNSKGYVDVLYNDKGFNEAPDIVEISTERPRASLVDFVLVKGLHIQGRVVLAGLPGSPVLLDVYDEHGRWQIGGKTAEGGEFSLGPLKPGRYFLRAWIPGAEGPQALWYPGIVAGTETAPPPEALTLEVLDKDISGINFDLAGAVVAEEAGGKETEKGGEAQPERAAQETRAEETPVATLRIVTTPEELVVGKRTEVDVEASGEIRRVLFYVDGELRKIDDQAPYFYRWKVKAGTHVIAIAGLDSKGKVVATDSLTVSR